MGKFTGAKLKISRALGFDIEAKGKTRGFESKCRAMKVGKKLSDYGLQLKEKQKLRHLYNMREGQFRNYYEAASQKRGATGENLIVMLESRLDNVVYRMGFAVTRAESRQLINHKAITVNGKVVNIASYQVKPGDVVAIREKSQKQTRINDAIQISQSAADIAEWVSVDYKKYQGEFTRIPDRTEVLTDINENLIVELYSK